MRAWLSWDRHAERRRGDGAREEHASCWMRVAQNWAGAGWGHIAIPRIGQEVLVSYIDADCDQPIITSRTYNAKNQPPYKLPEHKTRMSIKSKTHKGTGFNELRFEDEAGKEEVYIHAQRDMNTKVLNNKISIIFSNMLHIVKRNIRNIIRGSVETTISGSKVENIGKKFDDRLIGDDVEFLRKMLDQPGSRDLGGFGNKSTNVERNYSLRAGWGILLRSAEYLTAQAKGRVDISGNSIRMFSTEGSSIISRRDTILRSQRSVFIGNSKSFIKISESGDITIHSIKNVSINGAKVKIN